MSTAAPSTSFKGASASAIGRILRFGGAPGSTAAEPASSGHTHAAVQSVAASGMIMARRQTSDHLDKAATPPRASPAAARNPLRQPDGPGWAAILASLSRRRTSRCGTGATWRKRALASVLAG